MGIDTLAFAGFLIISCAAYYSVPEKAKPCILIVLSFLFAASYDMRGILFLVGTSLIIWYAGLQIQRCADSKAKKRGILIAGNVILLGNLILLKYLGPALKLTFFPDSAMKLLAPLGISYYTLQAVSYLVDVYWGRIQAERHYDRVLLFICYFPQILQGPISRYQDLSEQFYGKNHSFRIHNLKFGVQRILWGCFKVYVISGRLAPHVGYAFHSGTQAYGLAAFVGLVLFGIQLYSNFSGGMDIIQGISECLAIQLPDNFRQPYFAVSLGDFWRRWHITMGTWIKDYVFYPFSMSRAVSRCKKKAKKVMPRKWINRLTIAGANIVAFLVVGFWHGLGTNYILWGLYNGLILAISELLADAYKKGKTLCRIQDQSTGWYLFSLLRTFLIVTIGWCTDCASTMSGSFRILINMFCFSKTDLSILQYSTLSSTLLAAASVAVLLAVDILHERQISIRKKINRWPVFWQMIFWVAVIQCIALIGGDKTGSGFIYAHF